MGINYLPTGFLAGCLVAIPQDFAFFTALREEGISTIHDEDETSQQNSQSVQLFQKAFLQHSERKDVIIFSTLPETNEYPLKIDGWFR